MGELCEFMDLFRRSKFQFFFNVFYQAINGWIWFWK